MPKIELYTLTTTIFTVGIFILTMAVVDLMIKQSHLTYSIPSDIEKPSQKDHSLSTGQKFEKGVAK